MRVRPHREKHGLATSEEQGSGAVNRNLKNLKFKVPPQIAAVIYAIGIAGLFYLDRSDSARPSKALWLPVIWLGTNGSRTVSAWLGMDLSPGAGGLPPTSLLDQLIAGTLMLAGVFVLIRRRRLVTGLLKASWPILLYFSFALLSLLWSDFPGWGVKRWVRFWAMWLWY